MLDSNGFIDNGKIIFSDEELSDTVVKLNDNAKKVIAENKKKLDSNKQPINIYIKCCPNVYLLTVVKRCLKRMAFLFHKDLDILTFKSGKRYI